MGYDIPADHHGPLPASAPVPAAAATVGLRFDAGKNRLDLIPIEWIWGLGWVLTKGAEKYAERNWEKGMKWGKCIGCALRHTLKFMAGERYDKETGCHHLFMAAWNLLALASYDLRKLGENDLPNVPVEVLDAVAAAGTGLLEGPKQ